MRPLGRRAGGLYQPVVARRMGYAETIVLFAASSSAARATIRAPCWGHFGAARIRRDHALFAAVVESGVGAGTRVGGDWLVDHSLPLVPTQWHPPERRRILSG